MFTSNLLDSLDCTMRAHEEALADLDSFLSCIESMVNPHPEKIHAENVDLSYEVRRAEYDVVAIPKCHVM